MKTLKNILLVEDDPLDIELTLKSFGEKGLAGKTKVVKDGVEALDYLYCRGEFVMRSKEDPCVIFLDLKMPRMDGIQVLKRINADEKMKHIPIVVLTSSKEEHDLEQCYKLGANAYVVKPVRFNDFAETVSQIGVFWALINEYPPEITDRDCTEINE